MTRSTQTAFTLVEMIVSMAIFAVVAVVALGALVRIITANQKAQNIQSAISDINSVVEEMTREMRAGSNFHCEASTLTAYPASNASGSFPVQGCNLIVSSAQGEIAFISGNIYKPAITTTPPCNSVYVYRFTTDASSVLHMQKANGNSCTSGATVGSSDSSFFDLFSNSDVTLTSYTIGVGPVSGISITSPYPYVTVRLQGYAGVKEREKEYFDVQTLITSRVAQSN